MRQSQVQLQSLAAGAGDARHHAVAGVLLRVGQVQVAVLDRAAGHRDPALAAHPLPAQVGHRYPARLERFEQAHAGVHGDVDPGAAQMRGERGSGLEVADTEVLVVDAGVRPARAAGATGEFVDETGGPAHVQVGAERLIEQGRAECGPELFGGVVGVQAVSAQFAQLAEVRAVALAEGVVDLEGAAPLSGGAGVREDGCDADTAGHEHVVTRGEDRREGTSGPADLHDVPDLEGVDPAGAAPAGLVEPHGDRVALRFELRTGQGVGVAAGPAVVVGAAGEHDVAARGERRQRRTGGVDEPHVPHSGGDGGHLGDGEGEGRVAAPDGRSGIGYEGHQLSSASSW
ncbi:hypothetical protein RHRU231_420141 [Rhodococcus ruber]|uniref:Uncharacterized protein n=1 Tax=Rhodococcus ruber TaxID=1830 RepID=A0A098BK68_9NOCA|nr:hypothetical protein RHRU231_420141 [Rhodococcus ruber]